MNDIFVDIESNNLIDINIKGYTEHELELYDTIFVKYIGANLSQLIDIQNKYGSIGTKKVVNTNLDTYFEKLFIACCPTILKGKVQMQQLYQLHLTALLMDRYNEKVLKLNIDEYRTTIYFPNILNICAKHLIHARRYMHRVIKISFADFKIKSDDIIVYYSELYGIDEKLIINDINYFFLGDVISKFDPIQLVDIESIYFTVLQRMFYFYLKSKISKRDHVKLQYVQSSSMGLSNTSTERYRLYEEALYLAQLYQTCEKSNVMTQLEEQLRTIKHTIITNDLQSILSFGTGEYDPRSTDKKLILDMFSDKYDIEYFKNHTPIIYRILRSIHIKSADSSFSKADISYIRPNIESTLNIIFKEHLNPHAMKITIPKITDNLINSLLVGEYIDVVTMTVVNIPIVKFTDQLSLFLKKMLMIRETDE